VRIVVPGELPGMNEIIAQAKAHYGRYSSIKANYTNLVAYCAHNRPPVHRAIVRCHWYTANKRRDPDNIEAGVKYVLDGLVTAGVLPGDGWRHVAGIEHTFAVDKQQPRVEIEIVPVEHLQGQKRSMDRASES
jgi:hypothetical protein